MCGIVSVIRLDGKSASRIVRKRYGHQKSRGTQGFGYLAIENGKLKDYVRATTEDEIMKKLKAETAPIIIFHHRQPTSIENIEEGAHPIKVSNEKLEHDYYVIHNGVVSNDSELREKHYKDGFRYTTEAHNYLVIGDKTYFRGAEWNDSEALAIEFALYLDGKKDDMDAKGTHAVMAVQTDKKGNVTGIFAWRSYVADLKIVTNNSFVAISSTNGQDIDSETMYSFKADGTSTTKKASFYTYQYTAYNRVEYRNDHLFPYKKEDYHSTAEIINNRAVEKDTWEEELSQYIEELEDDRDDAILMLNSARARNDTDEIARLTLQIDGIEAELRAWEVPVTT